MIDKQNVLCLFDSCFFNFQCANRRGSMDTSDILSHYRINQGRGFQLGFSLFGIGVAALFNIVMDVRSFSTGLKGCNGTMREKSLKRNASSREFTVPTCREEV